MLYITATPIGNMGDITFREKEALEKSDFVLAEDTRKAGLFLKRLGLSSKQIVSFYEHNEERKIPQIISRLKNGETAALISSAGTPLVSDPGFKLVRECLKQGLEITSLPGASAVINALVLSGLPTDSFVFLGFLPRKKAKRIKRIQQVQELHSTLILFESPYRLKKTLSELSGYLGNRNCAIHREMTKLYEESLRGTFSGLIETISQKAVKGECVLVIEGSVLKD